MGADNIVALLPVNTLQRESLPGAGAEACLAVRRAEWEALFQGKLGISRQISIGDHRRQPLSRSKPWRKQ